VSNLDGVRAQHMRQGMRTAIRDVQDWVAIKQRYNMDTVPADELRAYLLALLITAGAYDDLSDEVPDFDGHDEH
jgi:hypothetical protein